MCHQGITTSSGMPDQGDVPAAKPRKRGRRVTTVIYVVVVSTGLVAVARGVREVNDRRRETGEGYNRGTGSSPTPKE